MVALTQLLTLALMLTLVPFLALHFFVLAMSLELLIRVRVNVKGEVCTCRLSKLSF